jgi:hypothetical protein
MIKYVVVSLLSVILTLVAIVWIVSDEPNVSLDNSPAVTVNKDGIEKVELDLFKKSIVLNVFLFKPVSCEQIIEILEIKSFPVKEKIYTPTCHIINDRLVKIIYIETLSA